MLNVTQESITLSIAILGFAFSIISVIIAFNAMLLRKSNLELTLYKNISDATKNFLEFSSKKHTYVDAGAEEDFIRIKNLLKLEVLNNLEYACKKYLSNEVDQRSFQEYYKDFIQNWEPNISKLKTTDSKEVFQNIKIVNSIFQDQRRKPSKRVFWLFSVTVIVYLALLCTLAKTGVR